jgi:3-deoxy-D-manno-octulosonic acid kinase
MAADAIQIRQQETSDGAILFDATAVAQAPAFASEWFEPDFWRARNAATTASGGRGGITFARTPNGDWALRHYRRGGMVARVMGDRYLWGGSERSRSFAEFRMLAELSRHGLNVSRPVAARYQRRGAHYRADLITHYIPDAQTLAHCIEGDGLDSTLAARVGKGIARLHAAGAYHADLNAHNVLVDENKVWLIDFDRGELRTPQREWQAENLQRLHRSLIKIGAARDGEAPFERDIWQPLMGAYEKTLAGGTALPIATTTSGQRG